MLDFGDARRLNQGLYVDNGQPPPDRPVTAPLDSPVPPTLAPPYGNGSSGTYACIAPPATPSAPTVNFVIVIDGGQATLLRRVEYPALQHATQYVEYFSERADVIRVVGRRLPRWARLVLLALLLTVLAIACCADHLGKSSTDHSPSQTTLQKENRNMTVFYKKIAVVGAGYVGLVTSACLADGGNDVTCVDINGPKVDQLNRGEVPIYEPGLVEVVHRNQAAGRLRFTTDIAAAVKQSTLVFMCVGTPHQSDCSGDLDLSALWSAIDAIAPHLLREVVIVTKSTVPVGTCADVSRRLKKLIGREVQVASNPEFLAEGSAIKDFFQPNRVVVGVRSKEVATTLYGLYRPYIKNDEQFLVMSPESAEATKLATNAMLVSRLGFINELARYCESKGADVDAVRRGVGLDSRIGPKFLFPGVGWGGSCFGKDARQLVASAEREGVELGVLRASLAANDRQKRVIIDKIDAHFDGQLRGKTIAVWGLAFKPRTDDIREAPALVLIDWLLEQGVAIRVHDPAAVANVRVKYGERLAYGAGAMEALDGADALAVMTEWSEYHRTDLAEMARRLRSPVVFDGRNLYDPTRMKERGFTYFSIGRP